jgi:Tfp pilus assembly protein FimT
MNRFISNNRINHRRRKAKSAAMTLVELLVVVTIMVVLMAVSVPLMRPAIREASLREASRLMNTYLTSARARAIQTASECGVQIVRSTPGNTAFEVFILETPTPYAGDLTDSRANLIDTNSDDYADQATFAKAQNGQLYDLVNRGDLIRFGHRGDSYVITGKTPGDPVKLDFRIRDSTMSYPVPKSNEPYLLYRQPIRSSTKPLQFSGGTALDLRRSGIGVAGMQFQASTATDTSTVTILFSPNGGVSRVGYGTNQGDTSIIPASSIFLLIGYLSQIEPPLPATFAGERINAEDPTATWIAIAPRTGALTIAENDAESAKINVPPSDTVNIAGARTFVRTGQSMGGR